MALNQLKILKPKQLDETDTKAEIIYLDFIYGVYPEIVKSLNNNIKISKFNFKKSYKEQQKVSTKANLRKSISLLINKKAS